MKILLVRTSADENTIFKNVYNEQEIGLAKQLVRLGYECGIVYYAKRGNGSKQYFNVEDKKIQIYNIEGKELCKTAIYNDDIYRLCDKYDIIQVYECDKIMSWLIYSRYPQKTILYHGPYKSKFTWKHNIYTWIFYKIFKRRKGYCNAPVITKSSLACEGLKKIGFKNVRVVGVGLDKEKFNIKVKDNEIIKRLRNEKNNNGLKYMLYIGKLEDRRNIPFLIKILKQVTEKDNSIRLIIVGKGTQKYANKCFKYAKKVGVYDNIIHYESMKQIELPKLYEISDLFLLPTKYEIFGMVLLEAMYFGVPVITTLNGGSSTLIKNCENGIICKENNLNDWVNEVTTIINNKEAKEKIAYNAYKNIANNYIWDRLVNKFINIYKELEII